MDIAPTIHLADPILTAHLEIIVERGDLILAHQVVVLPLYDLFAKSACRVGLLPTI